MPIDAKPLFRPDALRPRLGAFALAPATTTIRPKLHHWHDLLKSRAADKLKETELLADFLHDVFGDLLGYTGPASGQSTYTIKRESLIQVDGKFADYENGICGSSRFGESAGITNSNSFVSMLAIFATFRHQSCS